MKYWFEGLNARREQKSGVVHAASRDDAVERVKELGVFPTALQLAEDQSPESEDDLPRESGE